MGVFHSHALPKDVLDILLGHRFLQKQLGGTHAIDIDSLGNLAKIIQELVIYLVGAFA